ncbi:hypothetical protein B0H13DRAFT_1861875 [Mycena leptocephala]|nr:hypothetical protein B0H13DRAFT_1861875 [Mycena leptocephala]
MWRDWTRFAVIPPPSDNHRMARTRRPRGRPPGTAGENRRDARLRRERAIDAAAREIRHGQTVSEAAARHGVKPTTAWLRANGRVSRHAAREAQQALTHAEEDQLVADFDMLDRLGIRLTHAMVKARAETLSMLYKFIVLNFSHPLGKNTA